MKNDMQFTGKNGEFQIRHMVEKTQLNFPVANEEGIKSSVTQTFGGDCKLDQNHFLLEPVSIENLHNNRSTRNIWCTINQKEHVSLTGVSAQEAKTMTVHAAGQDFQAELTGEKKNYSFSFKTAADLTDKNISFDLGLGTTVYLDDVRIDEDSLIKNGSFNAGLAGFDPYCYTPSNVTYVVDSLNEDNAADFTINDTGDQDWHIQLKQTGVRLEKGQWYRLSLKMKSSTNRKVSYALQRDGSTHKDAAGNEDWTPYCQEKVALTNEYQTFTKEFQMKEDTDPDTIFNIAMGAIDGQQIKEQHRICIDDISRGCYGVFCYSLLYMQNVQNRLQNVEMFCLNY